MNAKFEISQCSSCGEDHKEVEAFHVHAKHFDWLAVCPMTLMPVYIATRPAEDDDRRRAEALLEKAWDAALQSAGFIRASDTAFPLAILKMVGAMLEMCWPFARKEKEEAPGGEN